MLCVRVIDVCSLTLAQCTWQICIFWLGEIPDTARMCLSSAHEFALPALSLSSLEGCPHSKKEKNEDEECYAAGRSARACTTI